MGRRAQFSGAGGGGGVAAHNILSATHLDSVPAAPVRGDLIVGSAVPDWQRFARGAALTRLRMNPAGTDPEWFDETLAGAGAFWFAPFGAPTEVNISAIALAANQVRCYRIYLPLRITITRLAWRNGTISGNVGVAIYSADGATRLITTGGVPAAAVNDVAVAATTIGPGMYWIAWTADNATNTFAVSGGTTVTCINATVVHIGNSPNASVGGTPPAALGAVVTANVQPLAVKLQG